MVAEMVSMPSSMTKGRNTFVHGQGLPLGITIIDK